MGARPVPEKPIYAHAGEEEAGPHRGRHGHRRGARPKATAKTAAAPGKTSQKPATRRRPPLRSRCPEVGPDAFLALPRPREPSVFPKCHGGFSYLRRKLLVDREEIGPMGGQKESPGCASKSEPVTSPSPRPFAPTASAACASRWTDWRTASRRWCCAWRTPTAHAAAWTSRAR